MSLTNINISSPHIDHPCMTQHFENAKKYFESKKSTRKGFGKSQRSVQ